MKDTWSKLKAYMYQKSLEVTVFEADELYRDFGLSTIVNDGIAWASGLDR